MSQKNEPIQEDSFENVEQALGKTEQYIEDNQNKLMIVALVLIAIVAGYYGSKKLYFQPLEKNAQKELFSAQQAFEKDSFKLTIEGDGNTLGVLDIIDEYGSTKAGNLSQFYAGVSSLRLGKYDEAIDHLKSFSTDDDVIASTAKGAIGDAYMEKGDVNSAVNYYEDAIDYKNELTAPIFLMKIGLAYEGKGEYSKAFEAYQTIKDTYNTSNEARTIDKYLTRAKLNM